jgi:hypothetical protein
MAAAPQFVQNRFETVLTDPEPIEPARDEPSIEAGDTLGLVAGVAGVVV